MLDNNKYSIFGVNLSSVRNKMELKVIKAMTKILKNYPEHDQCPLCIEDAFALSLNRLPSKYAQFGTIVLKTEYPDDEEIEKIVAKSIQEVANKPKHVR